MQAAKDTFLKTLATRLAVVNPARTVIVDGASRAAVLTVENETALPAGTVLGTFLLSWEGAGEVVPEGPLMYVDCKVSYGSEGTSDMLGTDRGRVVTAMDAELLRISEPTHAVKCDYTKTPPAGLGSNIFWTRPVMAAPTDANGVLMRTAAVRVFLFAEVG
jgi:hypothetical protein